MWGCVFLLVILIGGAILFFRLVGKLFEDDEAIWVLGLIVVIGLAIQIVRWFAENPVEGTVLAGVLLLGVLVIWRLAVVYRRRKLFQMIYNSALWDPQFSTCDHLFPWPQLRECFEKMGRVSRFDRSNVRQIVSAYNAVTKGSDFQDLIVGPAHVYYREQRRAQDALDALSLLSYQEGLAEALSLHAQPRSNSVDGLLRRRIFGLPNEILVVEAVRMVDLDTRPSITASQARLTNALALMTHLRSSPARAVGEKASLLLTSLLDVVDHHLPAVEQQLKRGDRNGARALYIHKVGAWSRRSRMVPSWDYLSAAS